jgi:hypothetical protein
MSLKKPEPAADAAPDAALERDTVGAAAAAAVDAAAVDDDDGADGRNISSNSLMEGHALKRVRSIYDTWCVYRVDINASMLGALPSPPSFATPS